MSLRVRLRQWFFRRQEAENGPIELDRRRIYILPTKTGGLFGLVLIVMYIGAVNYNLGLGHALVFLLAGLGLGGMLHAFRNLVGLKIRPGRVASVFAGENAGFEVLLENLRAEPRPGIHLQKFGGNATFDHSAAQRLDLAPSSLSAVTLSVPATQRGPLRLNRLVVSTRYPLGLFKAWSYPWPTAHCLVYPKPIFIALPAPRSSDSDTGNQVLQTENHDDFAGFRRHQPGDSPRHVAWKIYARDAADSALLVKEFAGTGVLQYWFDWDLTPPDSDTETRLSILCGWVLQAQRNKLAFGVTWPGFTLPPNQGEQQVTTALNALALFGTES